MIPGASREWVRLVVSMAVAILLVSLAVLFITTFFNEETLLRALSKSRSLWK